MEINTSSQNWFKAMSVNGTDNGFPTRIPKKNRPNKTDNPGLFELTGPNGGLGANGFVLLPYAVASDEGTFNVRVIGWRMVGDDLNTCLWIPVPLFEYACTAGQSAGVAGCVVADTELFADTLVKSFGGNNVQELSPADDSIASILADAQGYVYGELLVDIDGSATSVNALISQV